MTGSISVLLRISVMKWLAFTVDSAAEVGSVKAAL